jgi:hypothetical protein
MCYFFGEKIGKALNDLRLIFIDKNNKEHQFIGI